MISSLAYLSKRNDRLELCTLSRVVRVGIRDRFEMVCQQGRWISKGGGL